MSHDLSSLALDLYDRSRLRLSQTLHLSSKQSISRVDPLAGTKQGFENIIRELQEQLRRKDVILAELESANSRLEEVVKMLRQEVDDERKRARLR